MHACMRACVRACERERAAGMQVRNRSSCISYHIINLYIKAKEVNDEKYKEQCHKPQTDELFSCFFHSCESNTNKETILAKRTLLCLVLAQVQSQFIFTTVKPRDIITRKIRLDSAVQGDFSRSQMVETKQITKCRAKSKVSVSPPILRTLHKFILIL